LTAPPAPPVALAATPSATPTTAAPPATPLPAAALQQINDLAFIRFHHVEMLYLPPAWAAAANSSHTWTSLAFPPEPRTQVPHQPGVYAFVVMPDLFDFAHASGLFYIGKATDLYERVGAYIREVGSHFPTSARPHIWRMLNVWHGHLRYFFTTTADEPEAVALESAMLSAFRPPFNRAYEATVSQTMRAFE
jgi:hypothetical protein